MWVKNDFQEMIEQGFPGGSVVKNRPVMQEMQFWCLGWEDPLENEIATHSCIFAWEIPRTEETGWPQCMGPQELDTTEWQNNNCPPPSLLASKIKQNFLSKKETEMIEVSRDQRQCVRERWVSINCTISFQLNMPFSDYNMLLARS